MWHIHPSNCSGLSSCNHLWLLSLIHSFNLLRNPIDSIFKNLSRIWLFFTISITMTLVWTTILSYGLLQYPLNRSPWFYPYVPTAYFQHSSWNDAISCHFSSQTLKWLRVFYMIWPPIPSCCCVCVSLQFRRCPMCPPASRSFAPISAAWNTLVLDVCLAASLCKWKCLNLTFPMRPPHHLFNTVPAPLFASSTFRFPVPYSLFSSDVIFPNKTLRSTTPIQNPWGPVCFRISLFQGLVGKVVHALYSTSHL